MRARFAIGVIGLMLALASVGGAAQGQARDVRVPGPPAPSGTAALSGVVVSSLDNSRLIRLAPVVLIGTTTGVLKVSATDANGRFSFTGLPADRYLVGASKAPYLGAVAGAKRPARQGTPIALADGQRISNVTIQLPPGATISGTVLDERGQPAANVGISLMQGRMQNGERVLQMAQGNSLTDERGRYRIYGLTPGEYIVIASPRGSGGFSSIPGTRTLTTTEVDAALKAASSTTPGSTAAAPVSTAPPGPPTPPPSYAMVFYPGTTRASDAAPVALGVGEDRQAVDFRLELARMAKIEGQVTGMDAVPPGTSMLVRASMQVGKGSAGTMSVQRVQPDGRFTINNQAPGTYSLAVTVTAGQSQLFGLATVEVIGMDVAGVQIALQPALSFSARIAFEGTATPPALAGFRVPIRTLAPTDLSAPSPIVPLTSTTGAFTVTGVIPGRYVIGGPLFFGANASSLTWSLASVTVDGKDVTDLPIDIGPDNVPKDVVITYADRSQQLSGRLQLASGAPGADYTIVAFPADKAYWAPGSRRILTTRTGTDGQFQFGGTGMITLPAGDYLLAAVTELDKDEQFDPAFLTALQAAAVKVTVRPGEKKVQPPLVIR